MSEGEKLLSKWQQTLPKDGVPRKEVIAVMNYLGMDVREGTKGHS